MTRAPSTDQNGFSNGLTPYWQAPGAALFRGDSFGLLQRMKSGIARAVIVDPPYSSGGLHARDRKLDPSVKYCKDAASKHDTFEGDARDQRSYGFWCTLWLSICRELLEPDGYCLVFCDWRQLPITSDALQAAGFQWRGVVTWNKGRSARAPHKGYFRHQCEYIVWGTKGACRKAQHAGPFEGCIDEPSPFEDECIHEPVRQADKFHMTGKPVRLMRDLVACVEPGALVIDPFAGSATTGVACLETGRHFIGIEASASYCKIGADRLAAALEGSPAAAA